MSLTSSGNAATITVTDIGEVIIHSWSLTKGILVDETFLVGRINQATFHSAFIHGTDAYIVEILEEGMKMQPYDLKSGKESRPAATFSMEMESIRKTENSCRATESAFVCLSPHNGIIYYSPLPIEMAAKMNAIPLISLDVLDSNIVEDFYNVDNLDSVALKLKSKSGHKDAGSLLLLSFKNGQLSGSKSLKR